MSIAHHVAILAVLGSTASASVAKRRPAAATLLSEAAIRARNGFVGLFTRSSMEPAHDVYDDIHFKAFGLPEAYDVALRVWSLDGKAADDLFDNLHGLPSVADTWLFGARVFTAEENDIFGVAFKGRGVVALLTCGKKQCRTMGDVLALACEVWARIPPP